MLRFYLDTNVYDHIAKGRILERDVKALQSALASGKAASNFSTVAFEELIGEWKTNRESALRKVRIAHDLIGFENSLNPPDILMRDAVEAYAFGKPEPSPIASEGWIRCHSAETAAWMRTNRG